MLRACACWVSAALVCCGALIGCSPSWVQSSDLCITIGIDSDGDGYISSSSVRDWCERDIPEPYIVEPLPDDCDESSPDDCDETPIYDCDDGDPHAYTTREMWVDIDGDGYAGSGQGVMVCGALGGYVDEFLDLDCDDWDPGRYEGCE